ncbi:hypothetical protein, partial [Pseudomonas sp. EGD-AK9]|uniref:hypothetical protein n=1 Tax=Pseudomonas sp. EGD-AK9 TaxID=1386078 RepID=UPI001C464E16
MGASCGLARLVGAAAGRRRIKKDRLIGPVFFWLQWRCRHALVSIIRGAGSGHAALDQAIR